jgi:cyclopropane-fatty-acyl-phospholipid synthase
MTDDRSSWGAEIARPAVSRGVSALLGGLFQGRLQSLVKNFDHGHILLISPDGRRIDHVGSKPGPTATIQISRWRALRRLVTKGDVGFAEGYIAGDWTTPDLVAVLEFALANDVEEALELKGFSPVRAIDWLIHRLRSNSKAGSRRNIPAHYDLGNDFYASWLDRGMTYSSAYYASPGQSLEDAQLAKQDLAIEQLQLRGDERVLEIGCGWGALAERIAARGCHVTALTLSPAQLDYTRRRVDAAGLGERVDVRLQDYRDVTGTFDRIVSIEMIEAVGETYWPSYFGTLRDRLTSQGRAVLQAITIADDRFDQYRSRVDFIQRYVFPGGMLLSPTSMRDGLARAGLGLTSVETFGLSYAETLAEWNRRFQKAWPGLAPNGLSERFKRLWEYYLVYCEVGFQTGSIDVGLYTATVTK